MTIYGYARVSTDGQSLASQDAQLHAADCAKVYSEKISGARSDRPELAKLLMWTFPLTRSAHQIWHISIAFWPRSKYFAL